MDNVFILYIAVLISFYLVFSYWFSDKLVLAMSNAKPVDFDSDRELYRLVENLCITAGYRYQKFILKMIRLMLLPPVAIPSTPLSL